MSSPKTSLAVSILAVISSQLGGGVNFSESCGPEVEDSPNAAPWKTRLYGANKDRRASRKKRAKKLGRRR